MIQDLIDALNGTKLKFAHFGWSHAPKGDYGVYSEAMGHYLRADDKSAEKSVEYTVDYFTRNPSGKDIETIEDAFDGIPCAWSLEAVMFEEDSGYVHYVWSVTV